MRTLVAFLVTLLLLLAGGVTADAVITDRAERAVGEHLAAQLDADVDVRFGPWPVTLWLVVGHVPEASAVLRDVPAGEVRWQRVAVELADVRISPGLTLAGFGGAPQNVVLRARRGRLDADLDEAAVTRLTGTTVRLRPGEATIETSEGEVAAVAGVEGGVVVLRPVGDAPEGLEPPRFEPPPLPGGARLTRVQLRQGAARLTAEVRQLST